MTENTAWNPTQYLKFADERGRPFADLMARVPAEAPAQVVDLGCGPGNLTVTLAHRWPQAQILGIDSSADMIEKAGRYESDLVHFEVGDAAGWTPQRPVDVIVSNAMFQWVPGHLDFLGRYVGGLAPGGWFAMQVPGNFDQPSHQLLAELAASPRWRAVIGEVERPGAYDAQTYLEALCRSGGVDVEAWETTYVHLLSGPDPVFEWISGTGARPVLSRLHGDDRAEFVTEYKALLRQAYPSSDFGTILPFRRIFLVAHKTGG